MGMPATGKAQKQRKAAGQKGVDSRKPSGANNAEAGASGTPSSDVTPDAVGTGGLSTLSTKAAGTEALHADGIRHQQQLRR